MKEINKTFLEILNLQSINKKLDCVLEEPILFNDSFRMTNDDFIRLREIIIEENLLITPRYNSSGLEISNIDGFELWLVEKNHLRFNTGGALCLLIFGVCSLPNDTHQMLKECLALVITPQNKNLVEVWKKNLERTETVIHLLDVVNINPWLYRGFFYLFSHY